jgi:ABC-type phosphate/phosphonate transport system substrate-binding protein
VKLWLLALLAAAAAPAAQAAPLRIAAVGAPEAPCAAVPSSAPAGERAYYAHLAKRMETDVLRCPVPDRAAAARALAAGKVDVAVLDTAAFEPVKDAVRATLTLRPRGGPSRVPVVLAARAEGQPSVAALKGRTLVYGGALPAAHAAPKQALADRGLGAGYFGREIVAQDYESAAAALRSRQADAMVLHASAFRRLCRGRSPKATPCADLKELWRGRTRAPMAVAVRRDMADLTRYRLVGIHLALHMEAKDAFAWAASWSPGAEQFEPAEADAMAVAR